MELNQKMGARLPLTILEILIKPDYFYVYERLKPLSLNQ